ncbi:Not1 N-terminal domain, CCR4-Not complex component-domain-containing protein [Zychaea mexicana]|uniref:Not1 N-terminal domain, CCR4-Not complex component-domain-containing protein n=1 Tax=Zychaea mexicana TaxID=64656 RepID=UPI0022FEAD2F|nr:Not1 N-terminal domain, CCR4-Not complex component-domain-containing protein [Zychaea mexicana]KAI9488109.1 Not1 N-terminal domain, CCR4-Not complex component-domain-containing protein [Zychaea mexicana]
MSMKKLQTEIDRVLKKVSEGVETFETIFDKIQSTNNTNQKEKYEQDLKKEIKKLQRLRDQIKTWLSSNEIKDKRSLLDNRKLIESQMERFKAIEKEMKTKAYSKEGLLQKEKMDPREKEKLDTCDWITTTVDELSRQIETAEAELETLQGTTKRGKRDHAKQERIGELEHLFERNKWHINRLELVLRLLENDHLATDKVIAIKDNIQYYIECNQEPDFEEDEFVYDDLNLEEEEEQYAIGMDDYVAQHEADAALEQKEEEKPLSRRANKEKEKKEEKEKEKEREEEAFSPSSSLRAHKLQSPKATKDSSLASSSVEEAKPSTSPLKTPSSTSKSIESSTAPLSSGLKYAQAAAAGATTSLSSQENPLSSKKSEENAWAEPPKIIDQSKQSGTSSSDATKQHPRLQSPVEQQSVPGAQSLLASQYPGKTSPPGAASNQQQQVSADMNDSRLPASLADLAPAFEAVKAKGTDKGDMLYTHQMLDASLQHVPDLIDSERPKIYQPRTPYPTPSYYPQQPLPMFDNPALFEKFDMDALFFIFYYQQGTYQQYLAAKELKKQSWRFHKKYLTWFQRHEEPKVITDDYEQGTYIYFDYEGAWCQRKKTEFRFEYRYLEEA